jgi:hypothetical protein
MALSHYPIDPETYSAKERVAQAEAEARGRAIAGTLASDFDPFANRATGGVVGVAMASGVGPETAPVALSKAAKLVASMEEQLTELAEKLVGASSPSNQSKTGSVCPARAGTFGAMHDDADRIVAAAYRIQNSIDRIEAALP